MDIADKYANYPVYSIVKAKWDSLPPIKDKKAAKKPKTSAQKPKSSAQTELTNVSLICSIKVLLMLIHVADIHRLSHCLLLYGTCICIRIAFTSVTSGVILALDSFVYFFI
jgi:hypothetical protein